MLGATNPPSPPNLPLTPQVKQLLAEMEKLSSEVLGLRGRSAQLQLQLEVGTAPGVTRCHTVSPFLTSCHSESPSVTPCPHPACPHTGPAEAAPGHRGRVPEPPPPGRSGGTPGPAGGWKHSSVCRAPRWDPGKSHTPFSTGIHGRGRPRRAAADPAGRGGSGAVALNWETATHTWPVSHSVPHSVSSSQGRGCTLLRSPPEILEPPQPIPGVSPSPLQHRFGSRWKHFIPGPAGWAPPVASPARIWCRC